MERMMMSHKEFLNWEIPSLNRYGMMWFRDDDVEIGDDLVSILTIYHPLWDARDSDNIKLQLSPDDPSLLLFTHPTCPTFMYKNYKLMHEQDQDDEAPEVYSFTKKKHMKQASKIAKNDNMRLQVSEYQLPFSLSLDPFRKIEHNGSEIKMHYRTILVHLEKGLDITDTCNFVYWKVLVDGETTNCSSEVLEKPSNKYLDAHQRMSIQFKSNEIKMKTEN